MKRTWSAGRAARVLVAVGAVAVLAGTHGALAALPTAPAYHSPQVGVGLTPWDVVAADFDSDGDHDLAVANSGDDTLSIVRNAGGGVLAAPTDVPTGDEPRAVAAGDLDGDGDVDLLVGHYRSSHLLFLPGGGDGMFAVGATYAVTSGVEDIAIADVNGDGAPDVIVAADVTDGLVVLLNDGSGGLESPVAYTMQASGVAVGDLNGDAHLDLAVSASRANEARTFLGTGDGSFAPGETIATAALPRKIALGDIDGDGDLDLGTANFSSVLASTATIARNLGDGGFAPVSSEPAGEFAMSIAAGDVDGDGRAEFVTANSRGGAADGSIGIISGNGPGPLSVTRLEGPRSAWGVTLAHMDGGPLLDAVVASGDPCRITSCDFRRPGKVTALLNAGGGSLGGYSVYETAEPGSLGGCTFGFDPERKRSLVATDLTGDGHVDLAVANCESRSVQLLRNDGSGSFASPRVVAGGSRGAAAIAAGDVDRDGDHDLVVVYDASSVVLHRNRGDGSFESELIPAQAFRQPFVALADMDGDRALDVVLGAQTINTGTRTNAAVYLNDGSGGFATELPVRIDETLDRRVFALGDFDGDGSTDVVSGAEPTDVASGSGRPGTITVLLNDGGGRLTPQPQLMLADAEPSGIAAGDVDNDGDVDAAVADRESNLVRLLVNDGSGRLTPGATFAAGDEVTGIALADIDGDGRLDLAYAQPVATTHPHENVTVRLNEGGSFGDPVSYVGGIGSSVVLIAQLNGAAGPELVVADELSGRIWVHTNGRGGLFVDLDFDLVPDVFELELHVDPLDPDSDDDGLVDGIDPDVLRGVTRRLPSGAFARPALQQVVLAQLEPLDSLVANGDIRESLKRLDAVGERFDGCSSQKAADADDWVIDCEAQLELALPYTLLISNLRGVPLPNDFLPPPNLQEPPG